MTKLFRDHGCISHTSSRAGVAALALTMARTPVRWKAPGDRVTGADTAVELALVSEIRRRFPRDGVVAEDSMTATVADREFVWVLDPLDGTNNYALEIPCFAVSIAILRDGHPYAGVVHDPNTQLNCWPVRDAGAFRDAGDLFEDAP